MTTTHGRIALATQKRKSTSANTLDYPLANNTSNNKILQLFDFANPLLILYQQPTQEMLFPPMKQDGNMSLQKVFLLDKDNVDFFKTKGINNVAFITNGITQNAFSSACNKDTNGLFFIFLTFTSTSMLLNQHIMS